ncbi:MAG: EAL domain-containing protein [Herminiimonas sp.]|nr:EAL domain-containing protein [Herminiimonas sp.]
MISSALEQACAQEQIHLLGTVQPHGFLIVVDRQTQCIVQVSSGIVRHWPGLDDAAVAIGQPLGDWVEGVATSGEDSLAALPASYPQEMPWRPRFVRTAPACLLRNWECLAHCCDSLAILEWLPVGEEANDVRAQGRILREITGAIGRLRNADRLDAFFNDCVQVVREFSGFDRVMIYRFLPDGCGEVVAESTAPGVKQRFLGLRFPASDIPSQARTLYLTNRLRVLADVEAKADVLVPPVLPGGALLDQSHCFLRDLSPVHLSYLRNMGVRATLTVSIIFDGKLWGLFACHHHQPKVPPHQVREGLRQICEMVAEVTIMRIESLLQIEAVRNRMSLDRMLNGVHHGMMLRPDIAAELDAWMPDLLRAFHAENFGVQVGGVAYVAGPGHQVGTARDVLDEIGARMISKDLRSRVNTWEALQAPGNAGLRHLPSACGLLLAQRNEDEVNFCFVTRPEVVKQVRWGGKPEKSLRRLPDGMVRLAPRRSFEAWQDAVRGHCEAWTEVDAEALKNLLQIIIEIHKLQINRELQKKLHWRAHHDQLTGLLNRRAMEEEVARRLEVGQFNCALLLLDMDNFKKVNDTYGHAAGDSILQQVSKRLHSVMREFDLVARLGGDEFMLLMQVPHPEPDPVSGLLLAERVHQAVMPLFEISGQQVRIEVSIGIAIPPGHGRNVGDLLRRADLALYHAKAMGRSRSVVFELKMESDQRDFYLLEHDLNEAVERSQLSLAFQPKVDLVSRRVVGLEALVRWNHPVRGQSMPGSFIPAAERSDQIVRIDRWVMRAAVATQARWRSEGRSPLPIAINLSMADILSSNLVGFLCDLLAEFNVPPEAIEVEVTESAMMRELEKTKSVLLALNQHGISTTLDDFGTGFSSLSYLRQLPLQCLKIDQSFINSMLDDANAEKLTQAILAMGLALQMSVVAEGVETMEQMRWLEQHGCPVGQGYFFSMPVSVDAIHPAIAVIEAG